MKRRKKKKEEYKKIEKIKGRKQTENKEKLEPKTVLLLLLLPKW